MRQPRRQNRRLSKQDSFFLLFLAIVILLLAVFALAASRNLKPDERHSLFSFSTIQLQKIQAFEDAKSNPCRKDDDSNVLFITSITRPFRDHAASRNWKHTFWENHEQYKQQGINPPKLWVFNENTWDIAHGREPLSTKDFPFAECVLDVFDVLPKALRDVSAVNAFYEIPNTPGLNSRIMDGKVLMRKVAAIAHTLGVVNEGSVVIWVDVDVVPLSAIDETFLTFLKERDISYLPEALCWRELVIGEVGYGTIPENCLDFRIDTGIVAFIVKSHTRLFAEWWLGSYASIPGRMLSIAKLCFLNETLSREEDRELVSFFVREKSRLYSIVQNGVDLCAFPMITSNIGLNDIYTFALALHSFGDEIRHGWLAYKTGSCSPDDELLPGGHCHPCPSTPEGTNKYASNLVSPFPVRSYLSHIKGGTGIMARQHTDRSEEHIKYVKTGDEELLLPKKYFPIHTHIDHRMACGDKRGIYGKVWSLRQVQNQNVKTPKLFN